MKFYEVMSQIVLTGHWSATTCCRSRKAKWDALTPAQQKAASRRRPTDSADGVTGTGAGRQRLIAFFKAQGLDVYTPDVTAFRDYAQEIYLEVQVAKDWPPGMLERINAL